MTDEKLVERLRHCIAHPVYTHSQCEDALIAEAADSLEEKRILRDLLGEICSEFAQQHPLIAKARAALSAGVGR